MGYIINNSDAFINIKLTDIGRKKLAQGKLNFTSWAIGDSEINYDKVFLTENFPNEPRLSGSTRILRPFDNQPNITSFVTSTVNKFSTNNNTTVLGLNKLDSTQIHTIKATVNNKAPDRGFFTGTTYTTNPSLIKSSGNVTSGTGTVLTLGGSPTINEGDLILIKLGETGVSVTDTDTPTPYYWYRIMSGSVGSTVNVDRTLPTLPANSVYIIYKGGEAYEAYGTGSTAQWNSNVLEFIPDSEVSIADFPIWNMNNVFSENLAGMVDISVNNVFSNPYQSFENFGSTDYLGQKNPYFGYDNKVVVKPTFSQAKNDSSCETTLGQSNIDNIKKSISIIHYTNNTISNFYGEFLYNDDDEKKNLKLALPTIMYHRRGYATGSGVNMGMNFIASGSTKLIKNTEIEYIDLIEDPSMIFSGDTPNVVGRIFPALKTIVIHDDEIVAATSYKSNRNWTLPSLTLNLITATGGNSNGVLQSNETIYVTYTLDGGSLGNSLPCQYYTKITNKTTTTKDVQFKIEDIDNLPYMNSGFSANSFKVLYQIMDNAVDRPLPGAWKVHEFLNASPISGTVLENANPSVNGFQITKVIDSSAPIFNLSTSLDMPKHTDPDNKIQFGDERFLYGNIETYIGATIYKSIFNLTINSNDFKKTENPTRDDSQTNTPDIRISEFGIYDNNNDLVMISKLSKPIQLKSGNTVMVELSMDF